MANNAEETPAEVTIEEWHKEEVERLAAFFHEYKRASIRAPDKFPERQLLGQWDEDYRFFSPGDYDE